MSDLTPAQWALAHGAKFPYDNDLEATEATRQAEPAVVITRGLFADLTDRRGFRQEMEGREDEINQALFQAIVEVVRQAAPTEAGAHQAVSAILTRVGRSGLDHVIDGIDADVMIELTQALVDIVREGQRQTMIDLS